MTTSTTASKSNMPPPGNQGRQPVQVTVPQFVPAPLSSQAQMAVSTKGSPATLNLDDIFGDCFFTPEGDAVFLSENSDVTTSDAQSNAVVALQSTSNAPGNNSARHPGAPQSVTLGGEPYSNISSVASRPLGPSGQAPTTTMQQNHTTAHSQLQSHTQNSSQHTTQAHAHAHAQAQTMIPTAQGTQQHQFVPIPYAGGISTTGLDNPGSRATVMGPPPSTIHTPAPKPMINPPQRPNHFQYGIINNQQPIAVTPTPHTVATANTKSKTTPATKTGPKFATTTATATSAPKRRNVTTVGMPSSMRTNALGIGRKMSDQQKSERRSMIRERNREHAKRSRIRKKFLLESLQQSVSLLKEENNKLRKSIHEHLGDATAEELLTQENLDNASNIAANSLIATSKNDANKVLDDPDFSFIKALQTAQQNFVVTDPSLPDNPIVYATQGFLNLTGYTLDQVLGRNCRFLQGPETDPKAVEKIRKSIEDGSDMSVCLLNYRVDGSTFWNQFFIAALRDAAGNITNYVGVQCKVSDHYAANVCKKQEEEDEKMEEQEQQDQQEQLLHEQGGQEYSMDYNEQAELEGASNISTNTQQEQADNVSKNPGTSVKTE
mmetsp:Transcript_19429/g.27340  ORF Transcript_19429/g.27340 Transcript_19429/m.27340 type:complete len:605 (-) Transcript_19429:533-2347(-)